MLNLSLYPKAATCEYGVNNNKEEYKKNVATTDVLKPNKYPGRIGINVFLICKTTPFWIRQLDYFDIFQ